MSVIWRTDASVAMKLFKPNFDMATRQARIAEFKCDPPIEDKPVRILCEEHIGTYAVPFPCVYRQGMWRNAGTGEPIEADVIGWTANPRR